MAIKCKWVYQNGQLPLPQRTHTHSLPWTNHSVLSDVCGWSLKAFSTSFTALQTSRANSLKSLSCTWPRSRKSMAFSIWQKHRWPPQPTLIIQFTHNSVLRMFLKDSIRPHFPPRVIPLLLHYNRLAFPIQFSFPFFCLPLQSSESKAFPNLDLIN